MKSRSDFRRQATRGWSHFGGLQHPKGVDSAFGVASARWNANFREDFDGQGNKIYFI